MRTSIAQLPKNQELKDLLAKEVRREVLPEKMDMHYPDFSTVISLFNYHGVDTELFTRAYSPQELFDLELTTVAETLLAQITPKILNLETKSLPLLDSLFDYLSEEDTSEPVDLIFVFGNGRLERVEKAVELYTQGLSKKLLFSGSHPFYSSQEEPEALIYKKFALAHGVPEDAILIESNSITTPDNVRTSLNYLDELGYAPKSIMLINSPYVQRRGWTHFKKYLPEEVKLVRVNAKASPNFQKDTWHTNESSTKAVLNEFFKMKISVILNSA